MFVDTLFLFFFVVVMPVTFLVAIAYEIDYRPKWWPYPTRKEAAFNRMAKRLRDALLILVEKHVTIIGPLTTEVIVNKRAILLEEHYDGDRIVREAIGNLREVLDHGFVTVTSLNNNYICCLLMALECCGIVRTSHWERLVAWNFDGNRTEKSIVKWRANFIVGDLPSRLVKEMLDDKSWVWNAKDKAKQSLITAVNRFGEDAPVRGRHL